jgi:hypothetical protein
MMVSQQLIRTLLMQLPFLAVYIVVIIFAATRFKNHSSVSKLVIIAMVAFILANLANILLGLIPVVFHFRQPVTRISMFYGVSSLITGFLAGAGWVFLIAALFNGRNISPTVKPLKQPE